MKTDHGDPMKYKTGKPRLGPLNLAQLKELFEKSSRPKDRARIQSRINIVETRLQKPA